MRAPLIATAWLTMSLFAPAMVLHAQQSQEQAEKGDAEKKEQEKKKDATTEKLDSLTYTGEVTVTATRVETEKMKTPIAVTTFDQETLELEFDWTGRKAERLRQLAQHRDHRGLDHQVELRSGRALRHQLRAVDRPDQ